MLDPQLVPIARFLRLVRFDAPNVMRRALDELTDQTAGLISDFTARSGRSRLESLRPPRVLVPRVKLTDQGTGEWTLSYISR